MSDGATEAWRDSRIALHTSIPKSGTHMLMKLFDLLGLRHMDIVHPHTTPGEVTAARMSPSGMKIFKENPAFFIFRDPRDVAVSLVNHMKSDAGEAALLVFHYLHSLKDDDERLLATINGVDNGRVRIGGIRDVFLAYSGWFYFPNVHPVRFENLIGPKGRSYEGDEMSRRENQTSDRDAQLHCIRYIMDQTGARGDAVDVADGLYGGTDTFREGGQVGRWKTEFKDVHIEAFNNLDQDFMRIYGYV